ncbi:MAG: alpha/beta fold hydrolase [Pseudomonadota bacterium]
MKRLALLSALGLLTITLAACATLPKNVIGLGEDVLPSAIQSGATKHRVFFATTRARSSETAEFFSGERAEALTLGYVDVAVPENHTIGQIERPPEGVPDPEKHFVVAEPRLIEAQADFKQDLENHLIALGKPEKNVLVFVHGYNTNFSSALLRITQFVHDTGFDGVPILFSWASRGKAIDYLYDLNSALQARFFLQDLGLLLADADVDYFSIVAHSMGNIVTLEAMAQLERRPDFQPKGKLRGVILAAPDVDFDLFVEYVKGLPTTKRFLHVLISDDDKALSLSRRIAGGLERVGSADPERLAALGLKVLDISEIDDKSTANHSKFADSPAIVQLIGRGIKDGNTLLTATNTEPAVTSLAGGIFRNFKAIPSAIGEGAGGGVLEVGN